MTLSPRLDPAARRRLPLTVLGAGLLLAGCAGGPVLGPVPGLAAARDRWAADGPASYTVTLESTCGERALIGTFAVTVEDDVVVGLEGLDEPGTRNADLPGSLETAPTVAGLLDRLAALNPQRVPEAEFDPETGMPTLVTIDPSAGIDDEECYALSDLEPAG